MSHEREEDPHPASTREKKLPSVWLPPSTNPCPTQVVWYGSASATFTIAPKEKAQISASSTSPMGRPSFFVVTQSSSRSTFGPLGRRRATL